MARILRTAPEAVLGDRDYPLALSAHLSEPATRFEQLRFGCIACNLTMATLVGVMDAAALEAKQAKLSAILTGMIGGRREVCFWMYRFKSARIFSFITPEPSPHPAGSGIESLRQILLAGRFETSPCLGTASARPTLAKSFPGRIWPSLWAPAEKILNRSSRVVVIGYSLPEADEGASLT